MEVIGTVASVLALIQVTKTLVEVSKKLCSKYAEFGLHHERFQAFTARLERVSHTVEGLQKKFGSETESERYKDVQEKLNRCLAFLHDHEPGTNWSRFFSLSTDSPLLAHYQTVVDECERILEQDWTERDYQWKAQIEHSLNRIAARV